MVASRSAPLANTLTATYPSSEAAAGCAADGWARYTGAVRPDAKGRTMS